MNATSNLPIPDMQPQISNMVQTYVGWCPDNKLQPWPTPIFIPVPDYGEPL